MAPRTFSSPPSATMAKANNRLSAVYIGPTHVPDLPGPPSPTSSASGLPSPPATNSTGSGGDSELKEKEEKERALSSVQPPPSPQHLSALEAHVRRGHKLSSSISSVASVSISSVVVPKGASILEETLPLPEMDDEEDTARFDTLHRVKSLKDRNRIVRPSFLLLLVFFSYCFVPRSSTN